jgi:hypothetical protein
MVGDKVKQILWVPSFTPTYKKFQLGEENLYQGWSKGQGSK